MRDDCGWLFRFARLRDEQPSASHIFGLIQSVCDKIRHLVVLCVLQERQTVWVEAPKFCVHKRKATSEADCCQRADDARERMWCQNRCRARQLKGSEPRNAQSRLDPDFIRLRKSYRCEYRNGLLICIFLQVAPRASAANFYLELEPAALTC